MRILFIIVIIFNVILANALEEDKVVALVNEHPITLHQLIQKEKLLSFFAKKKNVKIDNAQLREQALNDIISDHLVSEASKKYDIQYSDDEINKVIDNIVTIYKIKKDLLSKELKQNNILEETLTNFAVFNIIRDKVIYEIMASDITVHGNEIDDIIMEQNVKDFWVNSRVVYSDDLSNENYERMIKLQKTIDPDRDIKKIKLEKNIYIKEVNDYLSNLPNHIKQLVVNLKNSKKSGVINNGEQLIFITLSNINIAKLDTQESEYITNFLGQKKLIGRMNKYISDLHKNAYIKILM